MCSTHTLHWSLVVFFVIFYCICINTLALNSDINEILPDFFRNTYDPLLRIHKYIGTFSNLLTSRLNHVVMGLKKCLAHINKLSYFRVSQMSRKLIWAANYATNGSRILLLIRNHSKNITQLFTRHDAMGTFSWNR